MKTFRVDVRIRNNLLVRRREELGLSAPKFAKRIGLCYATYLDLENMKASPFYQDCYINHITGRRGWKDVALQIANFHGVSPDELWPDAVLKVRKPFVSLEMDVEDLAAFADTSKRELPETAAISSAAEAAIRRSLTELDPIEEKILRLRFGLSSGHASRVTWHDDIKEAHSLCDDERTLEETARILGKGWTRERVRQCEARALKKLRHPARSKYLKDFHRDEST